MLGGSSDDAAAAPSLWVARVRVAQGPAAEVDKAGTLSVRMWTDGQAPGPATQCEAIADPFADPFADPWALAQGPALEGLFNGASSCELGALTLAPPVRARKVIGIGRNYAAHAVELGNEVPTTPLSFFKAPTCLLASGDAIRLPAGYDRIDMEAELVVIIGRRARKVGREHAWAHIAGYCLGNDVSCRDLQKRDRQWTRAKGFDSFGPLGPFIRMTPSGFVPPIEHMSVHGYLDDQCVQSGDCSLMIFDIPMLIEHLSEVMTLEPGDAIYTGTPAGVSALRPGAVCSVRVEGFELGRLTNPCVRD